MAAIDYYGIASQIQEIIRNDEAVMDLADPMNIVINEEIPRSAESMPWCGIYYLSWEDAGSPLAAGTRQRERIAYEIYTYCFSMRGAEEAARLNQDFVGKIKRAISANVTINQTCERFRFVGGDFESGRTDIGFIMGASLRLAVDAMATTLI